MLYPTIKQLAGDRFNRYELVIATAKCARIVTDEYSRQREAAEKLLSENKDAEKTAAAMVDKEYRDEKAVKVAISHIYSGDFVIEHAPADEDGEPAACEAAEEQTA